jgi:hypothetical protein
MNKSNYLANQQQVLGFDVPLTSVSRKLCKNAGVGLGFLQTVQKCWLFLI